MKQCSSCRQLKNISYFHKNVTRKDGLHHACKECQVLRTSKRYYNTKKYRDFKKEYWDGRNKALIIIGRGYIRCMECDGLNDLEIHHINGDGRDDRCKWYGSTFYNAIINGKRDISDLVLLCKRCNLLHLLLTYES